MKSLERLQLVDLERLQAVVDQIASDWRLSPNFFIPADVGQAQNPDKAVLRWLIVEGYLIYIGDELHIGRNLDDLDILRNEIAKRITHEKQGGEKITLDAHGQVYKGKKPQFQFRMRDGQKSAAWEILSLLIAKHERDPEAYVSATEISAAGLKGGRFRRGKKDLLEKMFKYEIPIEERSDRALRLSSMQGVR